MLGRGVKRKWSCLEELEDAAPGGEEAKLHPLNVSTSSAPGDGPRAAQSQSQSKSQSQAQQRQLVLGLCLEKLQAGVELSLRRSVLLVNTLRTLQEDMQSENVHHESHHLRDSIEEDTAVTCPDCEEAEDNMDESFSSLPELSHREEGGGLSDQKSLPSAFSDAVSAMGYLGDLALDDIFEDIDTSMYETSDLTAAWTNGELWPDEDGKVRPPQGALQACFSDLNELDHIMEILVKS